MQSGTDRSRAAEEAMVRELPLRRKVLFLLTIWISLFLIAELGARIGGYLIYDRSPFFLFYGISSFMADEDPEGHSAAYKGYFKFPPSRSLKQYGLFKDPTPIRINNHGFRGPDFTLQKPDGVLRVICLGESSTFGFYDQDDGTYPAILHQILNDSGMARPGGRFEVINAGIPHANSDNIRAMVENELLEDHPDILTVYAGYNDAISLMSPSKLVQALTWIHGHFASYVALKTILTKLGGPTLPSRWSVQVSGSDSSRVNQQVRLHNQRYAANVGRIIELAKARGIRVVLVKQALSTWGDSGNSSYSQKVTTALQTIESGGKIDGHQSTMVVHAGLMHVLDSLGTADGLPVLDFISIADQHPDYFASYVHLTEDANRALATLIKHGIQSPVPAGTSKPMKP